MIILYIFKVFGTTHILQKTTPDFKIIFAIYVFTFFHEKYTKPLKEKNIEEN